MINNWLFRIDISNFIDFWHGIYTYKKDKYILMFSLKLLWWVVIIPRGSSAQTSLLSLLIEKGNEELQFLPRLKFFLWWSCSQFNSLFHNKLIVFSRWNHDYVLTFNYVEFKSQFLLYWFWYSMVIFDHQPKLFVTRSLSWSYCMHFLWRLHEKYITTTSTIVSRYLSGLWVVYHFLFQYLISGNFL